MSTAPAIADMQHDQRVAQRWPPERFYWTITEAPLSKSIGAARQIPPGLLEDLACDVPVIVSDLHAVAAMAEMAGSPDTSGSAAASMIIIIAAPREELEQARAAGALSVVPTVLPDFAKHTGIAPESMNLLVGDFEPAMLKARRTRAHLIAACTIALLAGIVSLGLLRRADAWERAAAFAQQDLTVLHTAHTGSVGTASSKTLIEELERIRRVNQAAAQVRPPADAAPALADVLNAWPKVTSAKPLSLNLSAAEATLAVVVESDPSEFLISFKPPTGWTLEEPRMSTVGGSSAGTTSLTRIGLRLLRPAPTQRSNAGGSK